MNTETMITELNAVAEKHKNDFVPTFQTNITAMCRDIIPKLKRLSEYEAVGTVEECREARKGQKGKKLSGKNEQRKIYMCQCGNTRINTMDNFCCICGAKIDWSE